MTWVKTNLNLVITIVIAVLGITGLAMGIVMSDVQARMQSDVSTLSSLSSSKGSNATAIEEARKDAEQVKRKLDTALKGFESIGNHTPILPEIFPKLPESAAAAYKFQPEYVKALKAMLAKLHYTEAPDQLDFRKESDTIDNQKRKEARENTIGVDPKSRPAGSRGVVRATSAPAPLAAVPKAAAPLTRDEKAKSDPQIRASIRAAHNGYCYASLGPGMGLGGKEGNAPSFVLPELLTKNEAPSVEQMWYAQTILWIEQDMVDALAGINNAAAEKLPEKERWVGNLPIKHLVKISMEGYAPPTIATPTAFTARPSKDGVDVITFSLDLYLNAQYLPAVLSAITKEGLYTPLLVNYEAYSPVTELVGFIYGSQPVIHATIVFEGCFLRTKYEKWMPETVSKAITAGAASLGQPGAGGQAPQMQMMNPRINSPAYGPGPGPGREMLEGGRNRG